MKSSIGFALLRDLASARAEPQKPVTFLTPRRPARLPLRRCAKRTLMRALLWFAAASIAGCTTQQDLGNHPATPDASSPPNVGAMCTSSYDCTESECVDGMCLVASPLTCHLSDDGKDDCDDSSVCRNGAQGLRCYALPACPDNGVCASDPSKQIYAMCNKGALSAKSRVCVPGRCLATSDCGTNVCIHLEPSDLIGHCVTAEEALAKGSVGGTSYENELRWVELVGMCASTGSGVGGGGTCNQSPDICPVACCTCEGIADGFLVQSCNSGIFSCDDPAAACGNLGGATLKRCTLK
jgi:hypothetical protein